MDSGQQPPGHVGQLDLRVLLHMGLHAQFADDSDEQIDGRLQTYLLSLVTPQPPPPPLPPPLQLPGGGLPPPPGPLPPLPPAAPVVPAPNGPVAHADVTVSWKSLTLSPIDRMRHYSCRLSRRVALVALWALEDKKKPALWC
ncbi:uncharacterized protein PHACADRAFT_198409 [Phanerochaete carnosa HHB-10118-sp]|uniref:Uncharacterized protein n=1 Tax=Phanerochaete carnosa (strain HHB-10118-sp) TaxID=650164 RepID=K5WPU9_PHACS|nr:uncharacterized protein PHACADRAFT_198409 [Phanerochaete carnosa HHB-10118-sp]EKM52347.1 hypothetical protein PHACADRAFT_198409 [Phanerochaete carnosa HHB-10118-sp]